MTLVPKKTPTTMNDLKRELDYPRIRAPPDINKYPYLWDVYPQLNDMDELARRRVREQLILSTCNDWLDSPYSRTNYYPGERVYVDDKGFHVDIDVRQFKRHEIVVKTNDDYITVKGDHDRRKDGISLVERHFMRKYLLPRGYNSHEIVSNISADGILSIKAPPPPPSKYRDAEERLLRTYETGQRALSWR